MVSFNTQIILLTVFLLSASLISSTESNSKKVNDGAPILCCLPKVFSIKATTNEASLSNSGNLTSVSGGFSHVADYIGGKQRKVLPPNPNPTCTSFPTFRFGDSVSIIKVFPIRFTSTYSCDVFYIIDGIVTNSHTNWEFRVDSLTVTYTLLQKDGKCTCSQTSIPENWQPRCVTTGTSITKARSKWK